MPARPQCRKSWRNLLQTIAGAAPPHCLPQIRASLSPLHVDPPERHRSVLSPDGQVEEHGALVGTVGDGLQLFLQFDTHHAAQGVAGGMDAKQSVNEFADRFPAELSHGSGGFGLGRF